MVQRVIEEKYVEKVVVEEGRVRNKIPRNRVGDKNKFESVEN